MQMAPWQPAAAYIYASCICRCTCPSTEAGTVNPWRRMTFPQLQLRKADSSSPCRMTVLLSPRRTHAISVRAEQQPPAIPSSELQAEMEQEGISTFTFTQCPTPVGWARVLELPAPRSTRARMTLISMHMNWTRSARLLVLAHPFICVEPHSARRLPSPLYPSPKCTSWRLGVFRGQSGLCGQHAPLRLCSAHSVACASLWGAEKKKPKETKKRKKMRPFGPATTITHTPCPGRRASNSEATVIDM